MSVVKKLMYVVTTMLVILTTYLMLHPIWAVLCYVLFSVSTPVDEQQRMAAGVALGLLFAIADMLAWFLISEIED